MLLGKDLLPADDKKDEMICDLGEILYPTKNLSLLGKTKLSVVGFLYMVTAGISRSPALQICWVRPYPLGQG